LARYIAKKLAYRHKLKRLLNPLKKEFKLLSFLLKRTPDSKLEALNQEEVNYRD